MPAADPLPSLREPARPHPPTAGSERAASAARFAGALSQVLRQGASGAAAAPRGDSPTEEPGRSSHSPTSAEPAEGPHPPAVVRAVPVLGAVTDPAPAAAEPAGDGPLPAARAAAVGAAETDADGTAALEQEEGAPEPPPAAATAQPAPRLTPIETAEAAAGSASSGAKPGDAAPDGAASHAAGVVRGGGTPNREAPGREAASVGDRSPATGSATVHATMDPRALVPNTRAPGTGAVEPQPLDASRAPDVPADAAGETARIDRGVPASRRTAARGDAASRPDGEPVRDTPLAPDPIPVVPAMILVEPAATPASGAARGFDARDVGPDGATSATTAAPAANGPPTLVPAASPASVRVARATPEADPAPPEGVPSPGGETPAAAGATNAPGNADAQPPTAPTADSASAPPQPAAQPAHAASSRPAESHPPAGHTAPRAAVDQLAPTLVQVAAGPTAAGGHRTVVRLDPAELGKVEVRVERAEAGPAQVSLTVDRPETLLLLLRDQPALHRALDQAGVPAEGRTLHFQLAPAPPEGAPADRGATAGWGATADGGKGDGTWNGPGHGQGHGGQPGGRHRGHAPADAAAYGIHEAWRDAGLDITA